MISIWNKTRAVPWLRNALIRAVYIEVGLKWTALIREVICNLGSLLCYASIIMQGRLPNPLVLETWFNFQSSISFHSIGYYVILCWVSNITLPAELIVYINSTWPQLLGQPATFASPHLCSPLLYHVPVAADLRLRLFATFTSVLGRDWLSCVVCVSLHYQNHE